MPLFKVKLIHPIGTSVTVQYGEIEGADARGLAGLWAWNGYYKCIVGYPREGNNDFPEEELIIPWHMVASIDPVPYPTVKVD